MQRYKAYYYQGIGNRQWAIVNSIKNYTLYFFWLFYNGYDTLRLLSLNLENETAM